MKESLVKFDFYRGFSAVVVVLAHAFQVFLYNIEGVSVYSLYVSNVAIFAVVVFFLLSGFLVSKSIISNRSRYGYFDWVEYFSSRLARIYPPFVFSVFVVFLVYLIVYCFKLPGSALNPFAVEVSSYLGREFYTVSVRDFVASFLMLGGLHSLNGPLWSLYYEFQLYSLAMLLGCGVLNKKVAPLLAFLFLFFLLNSLRGEFWVYAFIWFIGAFFAFFRERVWCKNIFVALGVLSFCLIVIFSVLGMQKDFFWGGGSWFVGVILMAVIFSGLIFYIDFNARGFFSWMAEFSYTLYIIHFPLMCLTLSVSIYFWKGNVPWGGGAIIGVGISILVSWFSAKYLEKVSRFKPFFLNLLRKGDGIFKRGIAGIVSDN
jgi:peptidoglycan/LPS O-acetylase OafA/YrhL